MVMNRPEIYFLRTSAKGEIFLSYSRVVVVVVWCCCVLIIITTAEALASLPLPTVGGWRIGGEREREVHTQRFQLAPGRLYTSSSRSC